MLIPRRGVESILSSARSIVAVTEEVFTQNRLSMGIWNLIGRRVSTVGAGARKILTGLSAVTG